MGRDIVYHGVHNAMHERSHTMNSSEFSHVLFFRQVEALEQSLEQRRSSAAGDNLSAARDAWYREQIPSKEAFLARMDDYAQHGGPDPSPIRQSAEDLAESFEYATAQSGKQRCEDFAKSAQGWAFHLEDYAAAVHAPGGPRILELATGAGLGTWAVLSRIPKESTLLSMDFDFVCTQNALGIAKALGAEDRVAAICANNWHMPFRGGLFDTVCTHYGLDETREVPAVLREIARVLRPGGQFVLIARMDPLDRHGPWFKLFGVTEAEGRDILRRVRLYSGPQDLIEDAAACGLALSHRKDFAPEHGHARVLMTFTKAE